MLASFPLLIRMPVLLGWGPTLWPHLIVITSLMVLSSNTVMLEVSLHCMHFWKDTIQSISLTLRFITITGIIMRAFSLEDVLKAKWNIVCESLLIHTKC